MKSDWRPVPVAVAVVAACCSLQGCLYGQDLAHVEGYFPILPGQDVAIHKVAMWRQKVDSYTKASYKNKRTGERSFNSCMDKEITAQNVCNTHGVCAPFDKQNIVSPVFFCKCDLGWAGAECTVVQKSQTTAWLLSLFFGYIGLDQYYLDMTFWFAVKVCGFALGCVVYAVGFNHIGLIIILSYWFYDIVRIGSAPVHSHDAKVSADLPRFAFACFTLLFFAIVGFIMGVCKIYWSVKEKRRRSDMAINYCACDALGQPKDVKIAKGYDHPLYFGFPVDSSMGGIPSASLPIFCER